MTTVYFYVLLVVLVKEVIKGSIFAALVLNESTRNSPKVQYFSRNIFALPIAAFLGGRTFIQRYYATEKAESAQVYCD